MPKEYIVSQTNCCQKKLTERMNIKRIVAKFSFAQLPAKREEDIRKLWNDLSMSRWLMAAINKACVFCYNAHISKWKYKTNALNIFFYTNIFYRHCNVSNVYLCMHQHVNGWKYIIKIASSIRVPYFCGLFDLFGNLSYIHYLFPPIRILLSTLFILSFIVFVRV